MITTTFLAIMRTLVSTYTTLRLFSVVELSLISEPLYDSETGHVPSQAVMLNRISEDTGLPFLTNSVILHIVERNEFIDPQWVAEVTLPTESFGSIVDGLISYDLYEPEPVFTPEDFIFDDTVSWALPTQTKFKHSYLAPSGAFVVIYVSLRETGVHLFINCSY